MPRTLLHFVGLAALLSLAAGCAVVSPASTPAALREEAESRSTFAMPMAPAAACPRIARMLSWCNNGPNYHYRCLIAPGNEAAELTGTFEAVFRREVFLVIDFVRTAPQASDVTVSQAKGMMLPDYPTVIEKYLTRPECQPG